MLYGLAFGLGVGVRIPVATFYVVLAWVVVVGDISSGALAPGAPGAGRALPLLIVGYQLTAEYAAPLCRRVSPFSKLVHIVNGVALVVTCAWFLRL